MIAANNPTGYAQVLEERDASGNVTKTYTIGLDVVSQATAAAVYHLLYDAHGSTRVLLDATDNSVSQLYAYDAHGNLLDLGGFVSALESAFTSLLYSGEQTDLTGQQYLRARYYDPTNVRRLSAPTPSDRVNGYTRSKAWPKSSAFPNAARLSQFTTWRFRLSTFTVWVSAARSSITADHAHVRLRIS